MVELSNVRAEFLTRLKTGSTLAELPGYEVCLELSERAKRAGGFFHGHPEVPGLLLTEDGRFRTVLSRRYYHEIVGQYCGMDLYHPRPLRFMMERLDKLGGALALPGATPIEEAVRHGLDWPRPLIYEPLAVHLGNGGTSGAEVAREVEAHRVRGEQHLELAMALMQTDPAAVVALLDRLEVQLREAEALDASDALLRELHGVKGEASLLGFAALARQVHQLEDACGGLRRGEPDPATARSTKLLVVDDSLVVRNAIACSVKSGAITEVLRAEDSGLLRQALPRGPTCAAFVRVNPQLLRGNGITTLRFEEDRLLTDPDLQQALLASVEHVVGRSCPPEVFVRG